MNSLQAGLIDLVIVGALFLMGWALLRALAVERDMLSTTSLGLALGGGAFTWVLFLLSWAGLRLTPRTLVASFGILLLGLLIVGPARARGSADERRSAVDGGKDDSAVGRLATIVLLSLALLLVTAAIVLGVGLSYYTWDAIATWSVGGYGIALEGSIFAPARWGAACLRYPLNAQLLISIFRFLDGDIVPGSKLIFPLFYASLLIGCYRFLRRQGVGRPLALLGIVLVGSTPLIFMHATMGYTNLPMTHYLVMGLLWGMEAAREGSTRKATVAGFLVALAGWTRPEGFFLGLAACASIAAAALLSRVSLKPLAPLLPPFLIAAATWLLFSARHGVGEVEAITDMRLAIQGVSRGVFHWEAFYTIARYFAGQVLRFRDWGVFFPAVAIMLVAGLRPRAAARDFRVLALATATVLLGILVVAAHYIAAYSTHGPDFVYDWLSLEFNRVLMPAGVSLALLSILQLSARFASASDMGDSLACQGDFNVPRAHPRS